MSRRIRGSKDQQKKQALKFLFKKVVRIIIANSCWLDVAVANNASKISANTKKNIALVARSKRKIGMLSTDDRTIIRTPHQSRTLAERKKLCALLLKLKCFSMLAPKLTTRLMPGIKFMSVGRGRMLVRQDDLPITVYFIVSGDVELSYTQKKSSSLAFDTTYGPGDCIGDVDILEESGRHCTFITTSPCELLILFGHEFNAVLKPFMQKIWNDKKKALRALDYFDFLNEEQVLDVCKLSTLKQFNPLDTIYSHDKGTLTNVHFVLSGECAILQCLSMKIKIINGKKIYELLEENDLNTTTVTQKVTTTTKEEPTIAQKTDSIHGQLVRSLHSFSSQDVNYRCAMLNKKYDDPIRIDTSSSLSSSGQETNALFSFINEEYEYEYEVTESSSTSIETKIESLSFGDDKSKESSSDSEYTTEFSSGISMRSIARRDEKFETHFIDVGSITFGGIFGLGERTEQRVIMARTAVQCLILPRFYLLDKEQNPENIWQRRIFYLDYLIPSKEMMFQHFLQNIKWKKFKIDYIQQVVPSLANYVAREDDIPILCRIENDSNEYKPKYKW